MIPTLTAAVVLLAAVAAVHAVITARLVRRVRELERMLSPASFLPSIGHAVEDFSAPAVDGRPLTRASLDGERLVAFLAAGCHSCPGILADLAAARTGADRDDTIVFAVCDPGDPDGDELAAKAEGFARAAVVTSGPVPIAFDVTSFPALLRVRDGVLTHAGHTVREVLAPG